MNKIHNPFAIAWLLLLVLVLCASYAGAEDKGYIFPITPGTPEYKALKGDALKAALTVPPEILTNMGTDELVETCLRHPFRTDFMVRDVAAIGFEEALSSSTCFQELADRKDAGHECLIKYMSIDPETYSGWDIKSRNPFRRDLMFLELMLSRPSVLSSLPYAEKEKLFKYSASKFETRSTWDGVSLETFCLLILRTLVEIGAVDTLENYKSEENLWEFIQGEYPIYQGLKGEVGNLISKQLEIQGNN